MRTASYVLLLSKVPFILKPYPQAHFVINTCFLNFLLLFNNSVGEPPSDSCVPKVAITYDLPFWFMASKT
jgi:hypothetical protein